MLAVVDGLRDGVLEPDHRVFPVADVVAEFEGGVVQDPVALVVGVEVEVEDVENVVGFGDGDYHGRACRAQCAVRRGFCALEPGGEGEDASVGGGVDVGLAGVGVGVGVGGEGVEVGEG